MITREQAGALAALARTIRPAWDQLATMNAILEVSRFDLADITYAVTCCAQDPAMQTPAAITFTGSQHWRPTIRDTETAEQRTARLDEQATNRRDAAECPLCDDRGYIGTARCHHDPRIPAAAAPGAAAARAAIRPTLRPTAPQPEHQPAAGVTP